MEQKLKLLLPEFNINNSSNRHTHELIKITKMCHKIDKLLVFIERNKNNNEYFKATEILQNTTDINLIFLNKDDIYYYYIENSNDLNKTIMSLKRKLHNETECVVCMENCINDYYICSKCGHQIHILCFIKCEKQICSVCKHTHFMYNK